MPPNAEDKNPYQSPDTVSSRVRKVGSSEFAPCPSCQEANATKVGWTLWGGALGPWMFSHVKCESCGTKYNGKTGKSNSTAIAIYLVVSIALAAFALLTVGFTF